MMPPTSTFPTNNNADHVPEVSPSQEQIKLEEIRDEDLCAYLLVDGYSD
jgi:hypothetical protein